MPPKKKACLGAESSESLTPQKSNKAFTKEDMNNLKFNKKLIVKLPNLKMKKGCKSERTLKPVTKKKKKLTEEEKLQLSNEDAIYGAAQPPKGQKRKMMINNDLSEANISKTIKIETVTESTPEQVATLREDSARDSPKPKRKKLSLRKNYVTNTKTPPVGSQKNIAPCQKEPDVVLPEPPKKRTYRKKNMISTELTKDSTSVLNKQQGSATVVPEARKKRQYRKKSLQTRKIQNKVSLRLPNSRTQENGNLPSSTEQVVCTLDLPLSNEQQPVGNNNLKHESVAVLTEPRKKRVYRKKSKITAQNSKLENSPSAMKSPVSTKAKVKIARKRNKVKSNDEPPSSATLAAATSPEPTTQELVSGIPNVATRSPQKEHNSDLLVADVKDIEGLQEIMKQVFVKTETPPKTRGRLRKTPCANKSQTTLENYFLQGTTTRNLKLTSNRTKKLCSSPLPVKANKTNDKDSVNNISILTNKDDESFPIIPLHCDQVDTSQTSTNVKNNLTEPSTSIAKPRSTQTRSHSSLSELSWARSSISGSTTSLNTVNGVTNVCFNGVIPKVLVVDIQKEKQMKELAMLSRSSTLSNLSSRTETSSIRKCAKTIEEAISEPTSDFNRNKFYIGKSPFSSPVRKTPLSDSVLRKELEVSCSTSTSSCSTCTTSKNSKSSSTTQSRQLRSGTQMYKTAADTKQNGNSISVNPNIRERTNSLRSLTSPENNLVSLRRSPCATSNTSLASEQASVHRPSILRTGSVLSMDSSETLSTVSLDDRVKKNSVNKPALEVSSNSVEIKEKSKAESNHKTSSSKSGLSPLHSPAEPYISNVVAKPTLLTQRLKRFNLNLFDQIISDDETDQVAAEEKNRITAPNPESDILTACKIFRGIPGKTTYNFKEPNKSENSQNNVLQNISFSARDPLLNDSFNSDIKAGNDESDDDTMSVDNIYKTAAKSVNDKDISDVKAALSDDDDAISLYAESLSGLEIGNSSPKLCLENKQEQTMLKNIKPLRQTSRAIIDNSWFESLPIPKFPLHIPNQTGQLKTLQHSTLTKQTNPAANKPYLANAPSPISKMNQESNVHKSRAICEKQRADSTSVMKIDNRLGTANDTDSESNYITKKVSGPSTSTIVRPTLFHTNNQKYSKQLQYVDNNNSISHYTLSINDSAQEHQNYPSEVDIQPTNTTVANSTSANTTTTKKKKKIQWIADVYGSPDISHKFWKGVCLYNLSESCNKMSLCYYEHRDVMPVELEHWLSNVNDAVFAQEYIRIKRKHVLRKKYSKSFVNEAIKRDLPRVLLEMLIDFIKYMWKDDVIKTEIIVSVLLYLNNKDLEPCSDLLTFGSEGNTTCEILMKAIAESQNFSRFKEIFVKLTHFMIEKIKRFDKQIIEQFLERISILPFDYNVAKALISMLKHSDTSLFHDDRIARFENLISQDNSLYNEYNQLKGEALGLNAKNKTPVTSASYSELDAIDILNKTSPDTTYNDSVRSNINVKWNIPRKINNEPTPKTSSCSKPCESYGPIRQEYAANQTEFKSPPDNPQIRNKYRHKFRPNMPSMRPRFPNYRGFQHRFGMKSFSHVHRGPRFGYW